MNPVSLPVERSTTGLAVWARLFALFSGVFVALFLFDALVFRSGLYLQILSPESAAGQVEFTLNTERAHALHRPVHVLALGDSQMAEGFWQRLAEAEDSSARLNFSNVAVPGATMRDWYYLIRDLDPKADRYNLITIPLSNYADLDDSGNRADRIADLYWMVNHLRLSDLLSFPASFTSPDLRMQVFRGTLLRGLVLRGDFRDFLTAPAKRLQRVKEYPQQRAEALASYPGNSGTLTGLHWNASGQLVFPTGVSPDAAANVRSRLDMRVLSSRDFERLYRKRWLAAIFNHYRYSPAHFILYRMPQYPLPVRSPLDHGADAQSAVAWARQRSNVTVWDEGLFNGFERPEFFFDGTHLNSVGRPIFTKRFAHAVADTERAARP